MVGHHSGENAGSIPVVSRPTLLSLESMDQLDIDRFHMHVMRGPSCWKWLGTLNTDGYGHFKINNKTYDAHRIAAMLAGMDIVGKVVRHTCDHPWCMNPDHLIPGTHADNVRDRVERGRSAICERNGRTKLTKQQARDIYLSSDPPWLLSERHSIDPKVIYDIKNHRTWKTVTEGL